MPEINTESPEIEVHIYRFASSCYYFYQLEGKVYKYHSFGNTVFEDKKVHELEDGEKIEDFISTHKNFEFVTKSIMYPGCYFPRIAWDGGRNDLIDEVKATQAYEACNMLLKRARDIFLTVNPVTNNNSAYGHEIRALLLLSCMEVESNFVGILKENDIIKPRYNTNDYVALKEWLNLEDYEVTFNSYPEYPSVYPFKNWSASNPTQSLQWYDAYNSTKHNREESFSKGNLENSILSISALAVLLDAQFTRYINRRSLEGVTVKRPQRRPEQIYIPHPKASYPKLYKKIKLNNCWLTSNSTGR